MFRDRARLRARIDPSLHDLVDALSSHDAPMSTFLGHGEGIGRGTTTILNTVIRMRDEEGVLRGTAQISKPQTGMHAIAAMAVQHAVGYLERMQHVIAADRRPAAILFADLEASSVLARRLSTASYFALGRRLVTAADNAIVRAGGLVGRHVGDGVVAFFPAAAFESESQAARTCVEAARAIHAAMEVVAGL